MINPVTTYKNQAGIRINGGTYAGLVFTDCTDVQVVGVEFVGPEMLANGQPYVQGDGYGVQFTRCKNVVVDSCFIHGFKVGCVLYLTDGFKVTNTNFFHMRVDCIDIAQSWNGLVSHNVMHGTHILTDEHPDGVQMWSRPDAKPTANITISFNVIVGYMQCIFGGNHDRLQPVGFVPLNTAPLKVATMMNDGGFDNIVIDNNDLWGGYPSAINMIAARGLTITNNRIRTLMGSQYRASLNVDATCTNVSRFGNTVEAGGNPLKPSVKD